MPEGNVFKTRGVYCVRILRVCAENLLLLASNSPRRRQLLALSGWTFIALGGDVNESQWPGESPAQYVLRLAEDKARAVLDRVHGEKLIIGSDTAVIDRGEILGKPADADEAKAMLRRLRSHTHQVYTGITVLRVEDRKLITDLCVTDVPMRNYSDGEIDRYVRTGDPLDKAGAYGIQHPEFQPVEAMRGCYPSVMGLPLCHLVRVVSQMGLTPVNNITADCHDSLEYPCPVYSAVMRGEGAG